MWPDDDPPQFFGVGAFPPDIRAACREIQRRWTPATRLQRSGALDVDESLRDALERQRLPRVYEVGTIDGRICL